MSSTTKGILALAGALALAATLGSTAASAGSRSIERNGPHGGSQSVTRERSFDREQGVYSGERSRLLTSADGRTLSTSRTVEGSAGGALVTREVIGPEGKAYSRSRSYARPDSP